MKKMSLVKILVGLTLAASGAFAVGSALSNNKSQGVDADSAPYVGSISVVFEEIGAGNNWAYYWDSGNAKVAFYAFNNTNNKTYGWSSMVTTTAGTHKYEINYSFSNDPFATDTQFHLVRFNSSHSATPDWNDIWNRCDNISFSQLIYVYNNNGNAGISTQNQAANYINSNGAANNTRLSFNNTSNECYRKNVSLAKDEQFSIKFNNVDYYALKSGVDSTYFTVVGTKIKCNVSGTYDLYFDNSSKQLWVQVDALTEASGFAHKLIDDTDSICSVDGTGANHGAALANVWNPKATPDGTSLVEKWNGLTDGAKSEFKNATPVESGGTILQEAVYRYYHIMRRYGPTGTTSQVLQAFSGGPNYASAQSFPLVYSINENTNIVAIIVIISLVSVTAIGGYFFIKRRKSI